MRCWRIGIGIVLLAGCGTGPVVIDARRDAGTTSPTDASRPDAGEDPDAGAPDPDGGTPCTDPPLPTWSPVDTGGPDGESVTDCIARVGARTDDRLPVDQAYDLTTFGGPGDEQPVACSGAADADASWYYAANGQRFPCGQRVRVVDAARTRCVILEVADIGPNACVEEAGGRAIWDVSPLASQHLFGVSSAGWSEHRAVYGAPVDRDNALGPCDAQLGTFGAGFIGSPCASGADCASITGGTCLTDGWPGGTCTADCETSCPDRAGAHAYTACAPLEDGTRRCLARCDFTLFATGCRDGYACTRRPHPTGAGEDRFVCMPSACG